jgi:cell division protein FtsI (penicillin-binding protein 3)
VDENDTAVADMSDPPPLDESEEAPRPRMIGPEPPPVERPKVAEWKGPKAPNFLGMSMRAVVEEAGAAGLPVSIDGRGVARRQVPAPGSPLPAGAQVRVIFAR